MAGKINYGGKDIPLTKDGFPSKVHMAKEDRPLVDQARAKMKGMDTKKRQEELQKFLDKLGK